jgi:hypothetical protein
MLGKPVLKTDEGLVTPKMIAAGTDEFQATLAGLLIDCSPRDFASSVFRPKDVERRARS